MNELALLAMTAASIGFLHTILGPDHYIPFIVMSKAGKWSMTKTVWVTVVAGIGHVLGSVVLGFIGIGAGFALSSIEAIEASRGEIAGWLLISFGLAYTVWGIKQAFRNKEHSHVHHHGDGEFHTHKHTHHKSHVHFHKNVKTPNLTPWILFTIFVFGPCEALIPILMYPAATVSVAGMILVTAIFGIVTIATMLSIVVLSVYGINFVQMNKLEKYTQALAGLIIVMSGVAVQFLGL